MMPLFRCQNPDCQEAGDFEADARGECPGCQCNAKDHARDVFQLAEIHYLVADKNGPITTQIGNRRIACMPLRRAMTRHASGERSAVNCPRCKATKLYAAHEAGDVDQHVPLVERRLSEQSGDTVTQAGVSPQAESPEG